MVYLLGTPESQPCSLNATIFVMDDDGRAVFQKSAVILGEYPGDTSLDHYYTSGAVGVFTFRGTKHLFSVVTSSNPARAHIRFWSPEGEPKGWYINAGFSGLGSQYRMVLEDPKSVCLAGYNNRMGTAALFVLPVDSVHGCSPPYADTAYDPTWVKRGNQLAYLAFPRTDLNQALRLPYNAPGGVRLDPEGIIAVANEGGVPGKAELWFTIDRRFRVTEVRPDDFFWPRRDELVAQGMLREVDRQEYIHRLHDSVMYWTDTGWVTERQMRISEIGR